jgi:hypothetical protein
MRSAFAINDAAELACGCFSNRCHGLSPKRLLESRYARVVKLVDTADLKSAATLKRGVPVQVRPRAPIPYAARLSSLSHPAIRNNRTTENQALCTFLPMVATAAASVCCKVGITLGRQRIFMTKRPTDGVQIDTGIDHGAGGAVAQVVKVQVAHP